VDATERLLEESAVRRTTTDACGGDTTTTVPNNTYGHGRIDVAAAYRSATGAVVAKPALSVTGVTVREGDTGRRGATFTVTLSARSARAVTVAYRTRGRTARPGSDFVGVSGRLTFAAGQVRKVVRVPVLGDRRKEPNEMLDLVLSRPVDATLRRAVARGTIRDDD
jgi:chitinase